MEEKLARYRATKAKEAKISEIRAKIKMFFAGLFKKAQEKKAEPAEELLVPEESEDTADTAPCCSPLDFLYYLLWFSLWTVSYIIFIKLQFGTVFLIVSALVLMYLNTRTGPRPSDEVSAYSVFNKDCESIDGTLKAEQFEREIRYGHV